MKRNKSLGFGLMAALAALAVMAFAATSASATEVKPANTKIKATLQAETQSRFIPKNAYSNTFLSCTTSSAEFTTPPSEGQPGGMSQNQNSAGVGTNSQGLGSVTMQIQASQEAAGFNGPEFKNCSVREFVGEETAKDPGQEIAPATVTTSAGWTIAGWGLSAAEGMLAVGVPDQGATISFNVGLGECVITIGDGSQTVVMGEYDNENHKARIDGQVKYKVNNEAACAGLGGETPAQFEGTYDANENLEVVQ